MYCKYGKDDCFILIIFEDALWMTLKNISYGYSREWTGEGGSWFHANNKQEKAYLGSQSLQESLWWMLNVWEEFTWHTDWKKSVYWIKLKLCSFLYSALKIAKQSTQKGIFWWSFKCFLVLWPFSQGRFIGFDENRNICVIIVCVCLRRENLTVFKFGNRYPILRERTVLFMVEMKGHI